MSRSAVRLLDVTVRLSDVMVWSAVRLLDITVWSAVRLLDVTVRCEASRGHGEAFRCHGLVRCEASRCHGLVRCEASGCHGPL